MIRRSIGMFLALAFIAACTLGGLAGCSGSDGPISPKVTGTLLKSASADTVYTAVVSYDGRTYDGEQTTFSYQLAATEGTDQLIYKLYLELPDCAPDLAEVDPPDASVGWYPDVGLEAVRWTVSIPPGDLAPRSFSISFDGEMDEGVVRTAVRGYTGFELGQVYGPCGGSSVTGTVFVDANDDGMQQPSTEGGLADVLVQAVDTSGQWESAVTDSAGAYRFLLLEGTYTVFVDTTEHEGFFNGNLGRLWTATTPLSREVTVGPAVEGVNFGFEPVVEDLLEDLIEDEIQSLGVPVKFWLNQLLLALDPRDVPPGIDRRVLQFQAPVFTPEEIVAFLHEIEGLALAEPYQFTDGEEILEALAILTSDSDEQSDILLKELLTTELNYVADRGFVDDPELLEALILWGESLLVQSLEDGPSPLLAQTIRVAIELFQTINVGGGGGFDW